MRWTLVTPEKFRSGKWSLSGRAKNRRLGTWTWRLFRRIFQVLALDFFIKRIWISLISESARKSRRSKAPKSSKTNLLEQGDSAVSADTLLDVKAQRMKAHANEPTTCDIRYPAIWRSRHIPDLEQYKNKPVGQIGALPTESQVLYKTWSCPVLAAIVIQDERQFT